MEGVECKIRQTSLAALRLTQLSSLLVESEAHTVAPKLPEAFFLRD